MANLAGFEPLFNKLPALALVPSSARVFVGKFDKLPLEPGRDSGRGFRTVPGPARAISASRLHIFGSAAPKPGQKLSQNLERRAESYATNHSVFSFDF